MPYHPFVTRAVPNMVIRRERMLPYRGEVLVTTDYRVEPSDVIARTTVPANIHLLNVARTLSVDSADLSEYVLVGVGDDVAEGDVLAAARGVSRLFGRSCRSPVSGMVIGISNGRMLVQSSSRALELTALYRGTVINVMSALGAIIEIRGALIQGIWGSGKEGFGVLRVMVDEPDQAMDPESIDVASRGTVLVGGASISEEVLHRAQDREVQGIIIGGLDVRMRDLVREVPFPVVVTEGMGEFAISAPIFDLLKAYEGQEASIRGTMEARGGAVRPEIIVYGHGLTEDAVVEGRPEFALEMGSQVRIVRGAYMGETGRVVGFPAHAKRLPTGAATKGVGVRLESGEDVFVAQANVEIFG